jgi:carbon-monoxide dehydrogenase iron sulfur subunit
MKSIQISSDRCVGCMTCCNVCSFFHEGEFNPSRARLKIYMDAFTGEVEGQVLESCDLCGGKPECVRWCPVGALKLA